MSVKNTNKTNNLLNEIDEFLKFESEDERIEFKAVAIQLDILAEVSKIMAENKITRKDLADMLSKSKSFVSQLFSGDKMLNLKMIAKLQEIFNVKFQPSFKSYADFSKKINFSKNDYYNDDYETVTSIVFNIKDGSVIQPLKAA